MTSSNDANDAAFVVLVLSAVLMLLPSLTSSLYSNKLPCQMGLSALEPAPMKVSQGFLQAGCLPVVNIFPKIERHTLGSKTALESVPSRIRRITAKVLMRLVGDDVDVGGILESLWVWECRGTGK